MSPRNRRELERERRRRHSKVKTEPALIRGLVVAFLALLSGVGFTWAANVDDKTLGLIVAVIVALIPVVQAIWTRFAVTANSKVVARYSVSQNAVVAGPASDLPAGERLAVIRHGEGEKALQPVPLSNLEV